MKHVAREPRHSKRDAILDAMLDVVVERGFHEAPMSLISERSGASAGVIYHHFASKDEIIQALYKRIHEWKRTSFLQGYSGEMDAKEAFIHVWTNAYHVYRKHLREMHFLEQYEAAGFVCQPDEGVAVLGADFQRRFTSHSKGGVLNNWPLEVVNEMTLGLMIRLAKQPRKLSPAILREVAEKTWEAVRAREQE